LLIHDSVEALRAFWGQDRFQHWLGQCDKQERITGIVAEKFDEIGFPSLGRRIMAKTTGEQIEQYLRELGTRLHRPAVVNLGGSAALILGDFLSRHTEDIDVVDEVPAEIRGMHRELEQLKNRYGLYLAHFQSHYLPAGWQNRLHSREPFGKIQVFLVDVYDVFLSKLFSGREKDRDDLRILAPQLDRDAIIRKLMETTANLQSEAKLKKHAEENWYILFGDPLPQ
jgi:hypothetical protein